MDILFPVVVATCLISWYSFKRHDLLDKLLLSPYLVNTENQFYRIITHGFVHADFTHLFFNMFVLWEFGNRVQYDWLLGSHSSGIIPLPQEYGFAVLYFGGIIAGSIPALMKHKFNPEYRSLGASGAVSAVLMAFILSYPTHTLLLFFIIPIPAVLAGVLFFLYESNMQKRNNTGIAHDAHIYGAVYGLLFCILTDGNAISNFVNSLQNWF